MTDADRAAELEALAALYAEHTLVRHPFAPGGDEPLRSRAALLAHFAGGGEAHTGVERFQPVDAHVHHTTDPEVVVFEFTYAGVIDGRAFATPCIFVVRVRDGEIVESRDYVDHLGMARAFGRLDELLAALAEPGSA